MCRFRGQSFEMLRVSRSYFHKRIIIIYFFFKFNIIRLRMKRVRAERGNLHKAEFRFERKHLNVIIIIIIVGTYHVRILYSLNIQCRGAKKKEKKKTHYTSFLLAVYI